MGSRGNIVVVDAQGERTWLYTHWGGRQLTRALGQVLEALEEPTPAAIRDLLQHELGADLREEAGRTLADHDGLMVDLPRRTVSQVALDLMTDAKSARLDERIVETWSFDEFFGVARSHELPYAEFWLDLQHVATEP